MSFWEYILLGIVQGISEFLPISSDGHLVILSSLLGLKEDNLTLTVALHFGTLLSILVVFRKQIIPALMQPRLMMAIVIATLPVVVVGLFFKDFFDRVFNEPVMAGFGLLITATMLFITPRIDNGHRDLKDIRFRDALVIGLFQAIAPLPGVSRSGGTIVGAMLMGVKRESAANFSFYIAVPALIGATIMMVKDVVEQGGSKVPLQPVIAGSVVAFLVGIVALKSLLRVVAARKLVYFAWYVLGLAILTFILCLLNVL